MRSITNDATGVRKLHRHIVQLQLNTCSGMMKGKNVKLYQHWYINKIFTFQLSVFIIHTRWEIIKSFNDINLNCHLIKIHTLGFT